MTQAQAAFAAGSVVIVRDDEWIISSCERAGDGWKVRCVGTSELVRDTPVTFSPAALVETIETRSKTLAAKGELHTAEGQALSGSSPFILRELPDPAQRRLDDLRIVLEADREVRPRRRRSGRGTAPPPPDPSLLVSEQGPP